MRGGSSSTVATALRRSDYERRCENSPFQELRLIRARGRARFSVARPSPLFTATSRRQPAAPPALKSAVPYAPEGQASLWVYGPACPAVAAWPHTLLRAARRGALGGSSLVYLVCPQFASSSGLLAV